MNKKPSRQIAEQIDICTKEVLTCGEAALYLGVSKSCVYKLTMSNQIPYYKSPSGKMNYFNRKELEAWMQSCRISTSEELQQKANNYCSRNKA